MPALNEDKGRPHIEQFSCSGIHVVFGLNFGSGEGFCFRNIGCYDQGEGKELVLEGADSSAFQQCAA